MVWKGNLFLLQWERQIWWCSVKCCQQDRGPFWAVLVSWPSCHHYNLPAQGAAQSSCKAEPALPPWHVALGLPEPNRLPMLKANTHFPLDWNGFCGACVGQKVIAAKTVQCYSLSKVRYLKICWSATNRRLKCPEMCKSSFSGKENQSISFCWVKSFTAD